MNPVTPNRLLIMGVAGCGKSTLAENLARALGYTLIEGDDYHTAQSQEKMRVGIPLDDADRAPWLERLGRLVAESSNGTVLACSALKRQYREQLRSAAPSLVTVFLDINKSQARARVSGWTNHLFPALLVESQFEALESPKGESCVLLVRAIEPVAAQVDTVLQWLSIHNKEN